MHRNAMLKSSITILLIVSLTYSATLSYIWQDNTCNFTVILNKQKKLRMLKASFLYIYYYITNSEITQYIY